MKLEPFSDWPAPWDAEIQKVFRLAQDLRVKRLRVKVELGTLRIQEGGSKLQAAVDSADRATQVICPVCGGDRARQSGYELTFCPGCEADTGTKVLWMNEVKPYSPTSSGRPSTKLERPAPKPFEMKALDAFPFPGFFSVVSDYAATGEGVIVHLLMAYADNADDLRKVAVGHLSEYFAASADIYPELFVPQALAAHIPSYLHAFVDDPDSIRGDFLYFSCFRLNRA